MNSAMLKHGLRGAALAMALAGCIGGGLVPAARAQSQQQPTGNNWDSRDRSAQSQDDRNRDERDRNRSQTQRDSSRSQGDGVRVFRDRNNPTSTTPTNTNPDWRRNNGQWTRQGETRREEIRREENGARREAERVWDAEHNRWIYRNGGGYYGNGYPGGGYYGNGYPSAGGYYGGYPGGGYYGGGSGSEGQGYRDGLNRGREDARSGRRPTPNNSEHFRNGNPAYRAGFARGYQAGYRQYGGGGVFRRPF